MMTTEAPKGRRAKTHEDRGMAFHVDSPGRQKVLHGTCQQGKIVVVPDEITESSDTRSSAKTTDCSAYMRDQRLRLRGVAHFME